METPFSAFLVYSAPKWSPKAGTWNHPFSQKMSLFMQKWKCQRVFWWFLTVRLDFLTFLIDFGWFFTKFSMNSWKFLMAFLNVFSAISATISDCFFCFDTIQLFDDNSCDWVYATCIYLSIHEKIYLLASTFFGRNI